MARRISVVGRGNRIDDLGNDAASVHCRPADIPSAGNPVAERGVSNVVRCANRRDRCRVGEDEVVLPREIGAKHVRQVRAVGVEVHARWIGGPVHRIGFSARQAGVDGAAAALADPGDEVLVCFLVGIGPNGASDAPLPAGAAALRLAGSRDIPWQRFRSRRLANGGCRRGRLRFCVERPEKLSGCGLTPAGKYQRNSQTCGFHPPIAPPSIASIRKLADTKTSRKTVVRLNRPIRTRNRARQRCRCGSPYLRPWLPELALLRYHYMPIAVPSIAGLCGRLGRAGLPTMRCYR